MSALTEAIAAHKAAWQAFQDAPDGPQGADEYKVALRAEAAEDDALRRMLVTEPETLSDITALFEHLDWYVTEEVQRKETTPEMFALHAGIRLAKVAGRIERQGMLYFPARYLLAVGAFCFLTSAVAILFGAPGLMATFSGAGVAFCMMWASGDNDAV